MGEVIIVVKCNVLQLTCKCDKVPNLDSLAVVYSLLDRFMMHWLDVILGDHHCKGHNDVTSLPYHFAKMITIMNIVMKF